MQRHTTNKETCVHHDHVHHSGQSRPSGWTSDRSPLNQAQLDQAMLSDSSGGDGDAQISNMSLDSDLQHGHDDPDDRYSPHLHLKACQSCKPTLGSHTSDTCPIVPQLEGSKKTNDSSKRASATRFHVTLHGVDVLTTSVQDNPFILADRQPTKSYSAAAWPAPETIRTHAPKVARPSERAPRHHQSEPKMTEALGACHDPPACRTTGPGHQQFQRSIISTSCRDPEHVKTIEQPYDQCPTHRNNAPFPDAQAFSVEQHPSCPSPQKHTMHPTRYDNEKHTAIAGASSRGQATDRDRPHDYHVVRSMESQSTPALLTLEQHGSRARLGADESHRRVGYDDRDLPGESRHAHYESAAESNGPGEYQTTEEGHHAVQGLTTQHPGYQEQYQTESTSDGHDPRLRYATANVSDLRSRNNQTNTHDETEGQQSVSPTPIKPRSLTAPPNGGASEARAQQTRPVRGAEMQRGLADRAVADNQALGNHEEVRPNLRSRESSDSALSEYGETENLGLSHGVPPRDNGVTSDRAVPSKASNMNLQQHAPGKVKSTTQAPGNPPPNASKLHVGWKPSPDNVSRSPSLRQQVPEHGKPASFQRPEMVEQEHAPHTSNTYRSPKGKNAVGQESSLLPDQSPGTLNLMRSAELDKAASPQVRIGDFHHVGDQHIGDQHVGDQYVGDQNIGDQNIGDQNIGDQHLGDQHLGVSKDPASGVTGLPCPTKVLVKAIRYPKALGREDFLGQRFSPTKAPTIPNVFGYAQQHPIELNNHVTTFYTDKTPSAFPSGIEGFGLPQYIGTPAVILPSRSNPLPREHIFDTTTLHDHHYEWKGRFAELRSQMRNMTSDVQRRGVAGTGQQPAEGGTRTGNFGIEGLTLIMRIRDEDDMVIDMDLEHTE